MTVTKGFIHTAATTALDTRKADEVRIVASAAGVPRLGVLTDNPSIVTSDASTAPMRVAVAKAGFVTQRVSGDGVAVWTNDGSVFLTVTKPGSNSHYVVIWAKHNDPANGDATSVSELGVTTGAAAASPAVPAIPAGALELARILIPSTATSTQSAGVVITNNYPMTATRGGIVICRDATELAAWAPGNGSKAITLSDGEEWRRLGGAWDGAGWQTYTPTWTTPNTQPVVGNGTLAGRYRRIGPKTIALRINVVFGSTTTGGTGNWSFGLPSGMNAAVGTEQVISAKAYLAAASANYFGGGLLQTNGTTVAPMLPSSSSSSVSAQVRNADSSGAAGTGIPLAPGAYGFTNGSNMVLEGIIELA